jgi:hypothetical protein
MSVGVLPGEEHRYYRITNDGVKVVQDMVLI